MMTQQELAAVRDRFELDLVYSDEYVAEIVEPTLWMAGYRIEQAKRKLSSSLKKARQGGNCF